MDEVQKHAKQSPNIGNKEFAKFAKARDGRVWTLRLENSLSDVTWICSFKSSSSTREISY
jgi:hypothetical protein